MFFNKKKRKNITEEDLIAEMTEEEREFHFEIKRQAKEIREALDKECQTEEWKAWQEQLIKKLKAEEQRLNQKKSWIRSNFREVCQIMQDCAYF